MNHDGQDEGPQLHMICEIHMFVLDTRVNKIAANVNVWSNQ